MTDYFSGAVAERYDRSTGEMPVDPVVDFLAELAGAGPALELGVGTGRIALPLAARGVPVHGIDLSPDMVAQLRSKPGGEDIRVAIGDFATTTLDETFTLAYAVFNTIINVISQEAQLACFRNVAAQLVPGGCFVVELGIHSGAELEVFALSDTHVGIDEYVPATQRLVSHHFRLAEDGWERLSIPFRSVSPGELDLMARIAGLELRERSADWNREAFTNKSTKHISVWAKQGSDPSGV